MAIILKQTLSKTISRFVFVAAVSCCFFSWSWQAYSKSAADYGVGRTRSCNNGGEPEGLDFNMTDAGKDAEFVLANPVCLSVILSTYTIVKVSVAAMNSVCGTGSSVPRVLPSPIQDSIDIAKSGVTAGYRAASGDYRCLGVVANALTSWSVTIIALKAIYDVATIVYKDAEICGSKWITPNPSTYDISASNKKQERQDVVDGYIRNDETANMDLKTGTQAYREWYYGGIEFEDNPKGQDSACKDPTQKINGEYPKQKYYMRGTAAGNFNCKKYDIVNGIDPLDGSALSEERAKELQKAYECCTKRSQKYICIKYGNSGHFCKAGTICNIEGIDFSTSSVDNGSMICAETYSLCPYNFSLSGGSDYCDYYKDGKWDSGSKRWNMITEEDVAANNCAAKSEIRNSDCSYNKKAGKCRNYCQYLTHCTTTSISDYHYTTSLGSPYFAEACRNFVGDSQNRVSYGSDGFILKSQKHFSAPIAQCVKETLENLFYNVAGHSECASVNEYPSRDGTCPSGKYIENGNFVYKQGNTVKETSIFAKIQNVMKDVVKLVLTLSIVFYGMNILTGKADIRSKKDILMYLIKIALVLFFATGNAWQGFFFKGVYGAASEFSQMVFKITAQESESQRDGCQFGEITTSDGVSFSSGRTYPEGKEYLALWDTLDCKMMRYLGYGPEASAANIASLILAGAFTGVIGIYLSISAMFFGFFFLAVTLRALHVFLASAAGIIILVFMSPVVIPAALFAKTSDLFKKWMAQLISYCLQPMILFAYIAIFVTIMDKSMIGSATFHGNAPAKTISCAKICKNADGSIDPYINGAMPPCDDDGDRVVKPMNDSVACLIGLDDFGKAPGFEMIGLTIPVLSNVFSDDPQVKVLTILKGALVMFLLYKFMSEISGIATRLIGGDSLSGSSADPIAMMNKTIGRLSEIQKRTTGAAKNLSKAAGRKASEAKASVGAAGKKDSSSQGSSGGGHDESRSSGSQGDSSKGSSSDVQGDSGSGSTAQGDSSKGSGSNAQGDSSKGSSSDAQGDSGGSSESASDGSKKS